jgi:hypothetical protein
MVPSAAQFKKLLREIYQTIPDEDPTKRERQVLISCVVASAEAVDKIEKVLKEVVGPALAALMPADATATTPATTPETEETEDAPPIRATTTGSAPAAPPPQAASISKTTTPVNGGAATPTVSVSAPQPVARS